MIAKLKGLVETVGEHSLVLDVGGVGYLLFCPRSTLGHLPPVGDYIVLVVETVLKQESLTLYGFRTEEERDSFRVLQKVQGVGAKVAMAILSTLLPHQIYECITFQDHLPLTKADGVGPKLAQRIVRELKDQVSSLQGNVTSFGASLHTPEERNFPEALAALLRLGYKRAEALEALNHVKKEFPQKETIDALIPFALKYLGTKLK